MAGRDRTSWGGPGGDDVDLGAPRDSNVSHPKGIGMPGIAGAVAAVDGNTAALAAFVSFAAVGLAIEWARDAEGVSLVFAVAGFVVGLYLRTPAKFVEEWHYAPLLAIPVVVALYIHDSSV